MSIEPCWRYRDEVRHELDLRLVRSFVAVAEELHFTRAAHRLHVAQQALSRDIRKLETQLGARLFDRSTRQVTLTADGERLLVHARSLLALNDAALAELRGVQRPLLVDGIGEQLSPARIVEAARSTAPASEFAMRYAGGLGASIQQLLAGRIDVAFGRVEGLGRPLPAELERRLIRYEPLGLLLLDDHPWADLATIETGRLRGTELDASSGNTDAPEWVDLAEALAVAFDARPSAPHTHVMGVNETVRHLKAHGLAILTMTECPEVPGAVIRPLVDPVPLYAWSMVFRSDTRYPEIDTLLEVAARLGRDEDWLRIPDRSWLPDIDARGYVRR